MTRSPIDDVERRMRDTVAAATVLTDAWDHPRRDYAHTDHVPPASNLSDLSDLSDRFDRSPSRTRYVRPLAAAAAVLVVAGGTAAWLGPGRGHGQQAPAATGAATTSISAVPPTARTAPAHVPAAGSAEQLPDLVQVNGPNPNYEMDTASAPGGQREVVLINPPSSTGRARVLSDVNLVVFPTSAGFDISKRMSGITRTPIAGHEGYYGHIRLFTDQASKHGRGGSYALGYKADDGTWLFVVPSYAPTPRSVATLRNAYNAFEVRAERGATRLPYRLGFLPPGLRVQSVGTSGTNPVSDVMFTHGLNTLDINISNLSGSEPCPSSTPTTHPACGRRTINGYDLAVTGSGYSQATLQRVADTLTVADLSRTGTTAGWWKLTEALNPARHK